MLIDGKEYKINVLVLLMEKEIDVTVASIETLMEGLEEGVVISILLNGGKSEKLKELFSGLDCIKYYESDDNLGVAGGRNFLLRSEESRNSEIIFILDNDVITPTDYIRNLATFLIRQEDAAVVGAAAANIKIGIGFELIKHYGKQGVFGNRIFQVSSSDLKKDLLRKLIQERLFHIGTHPNYYYAYFSLRPFLYGTLHRLFNLSMNYQPFLVNNKKYLELIREGAPSYQVSNVVGCSQAFRRELIDEIGYLNDRFNPYGFEDAEFCIRAIRAGYKNYIDTNTWLFHGTDSRHEIRDEYKTITNFFRTLTILARSIFEGSLKSRLIILKLIFVCSFAELFLSPSNSVKRFKAKFEGFKAGVRDSS